MSPIPDLAILEELSGGLLPLPDAAQVLGVGIVALRRMVQDGELLAIRTEAGKGPRIARVFIDPAPIAHLPGTISVLKDAGLSDVEALRWLVTPDETLPGSPIEQLRAGHKTEIRRRAQALAL